MAAKTATILLFLAATASTEYVPGTPGAAWSAEELLAVRSKLFSMFRRGTAPKALRLSFHDCVKYADGTGGCDGCLNWDGVDVQFNPEKYAKDHANIEHGNNNGLGPFVRQLEKLYTSTDYPRDAQILGQSLRDSGKSRADLWSYAAIVAVEYGIKSNNIACVDRSHPSLIRSHCVHEPNTTACFVEPSRNIQFQHGRADCTDFDSEFPYKATKAEHHPNPVADGRATIEFFRDEFDFNGRETVAIFGAHTFGKPSIRNSLFPYTWTSSAINLFNNDYYKNIVAKDRWYINDKECGRVGDAYGNRPQTRWLAHTRKMTHRGGPVFWIHQNHVCPSLYNDKNWSSADRQCVEEADASLGQQCRPDPPTGESRPRTKDEPDADPNRGCERWKLIPGADEIALNCEMGLYLDFQVTDGIPHGCSGFEHFSASMASDDKKAVWSKIPGQKGNAQPDCKKQMLAEPAGSTPLSQIMEEYADDQTLWMDDFTAAFEKMMRNGYPDGLTNSPDIHTNLVCPMPSIIGSYTENCYQQESVDSDGAVFKIGNRNKNLAGKVYQWNPSTKLFDFAEEQPGATNQLWRLSSGGHQLINEMTGLPLSVESNVNFRFEEDGDDYLVINPMTGKALDCFAARKPGKECRTWKKHGKSNQRFFVIMAA